MPVSKLTAKASTFKYNGVTISITKYTAKGKRHLAESTDSSCYDVTSDLVWRQQLPAAAELDLDCEAYFDKNSTNAQLLTSLFTSQATIPVILGLDAGTLLGHGNFDISDVEVDATIAPTPETVGIKFNLMSNGVFTAGS